MEFLKFYMLLAIILIFSGCADTMPILIAVERVGFFHGIWHGMISTFALIGHIFDNSIAVYAVYNNGGWYDFGFLIGVGSFCRGGKKCLD